MNDEGWFVIYMNMISVNEKDLVLAVRDSFSAAQVMRNLGLKPNSSRYKHILGEITRLNLSTSHWTGKSSNRGKSHVGGTPKLASQDVLIVQRRNRKELSTRLRRAMIEHGIPYSCRECGLGPLWNGKKLTLTIDHINGNNLDNSPNNVRFLCPNCHSQTENFGVLNRKDLIVPKERLELSC